MRQLKALHRCFLKFIWNNKAHYITSSVFFSLKTQGGLGAPDIIKYYYASHLQAVISWSSQTSLNRWSEIEWGALYPVHPCSLVWPRSLHMDPILKRMCLSPMLFTMSIWCKCALKYTLSSPCPPLSNILFNPVLPDSLSFGCMLPWMQTPLFQLRNLVHPVNHEKRGRGKWRSL